MMIKPSEYRIQPNEVRIGNHFQPIDDGFWNEYYIDRSKREQASIDIHFFQYPEFWMHIKPIELTEEKLQQFGFSKWDPAKWYIKGTDFEIYLDPKGFYFEWANWNAQRYLPYVHQLQNLYFALTGQELIFSESKSNNSLNYGYKEIIRPIDPFEENMKANKKYWEDIGKNSDIKVNDAGEITEITLKNKKP